MWDAMRACCCCGICDRRRSLGRMSSTRAMPRNTRPRIAEKSGIMSCSPFRPCAGRCGCNYESRRGVIVAGLKKKKSRRSTKVELLLWTAKSLPESVRYNDSTILRQVPDFSGASDSWRGASESLLGQAIVKTCSFVVLPSLTSSKPWRNYFVVTLLPFEE